LIWIFDHRFPGGAHVLDLVITLVHVPHRGLRTRRQTCSSPSLPGTVERLTTEPSTLLVCAPFNVSECIASELLPSRRARPCSRPASWTAVAERRPRGRHPLRAPRAMNQLLRKDQLFDGPTFRKCCSFGHHSSPLNHRALPLGRLTKRTPTHTPVPPNPAVEPLAVSFLSSFFWYELPLMN
jgi:hypothetical protein